MAKKLNNPVLLLVVMQRGGVQYIPIACSEVDSHHQRDLQAPRYELKQAMLISALVA